MMVRFRYKPITNGRQIGPKRDKKNIKFIGLHWTGNTSETADAENHYKYLQHAIRHGSAHYYVDSIQIIQTIGDSYTAWAVGKHYCPR